MRRIRNEKRKALHSMARSMARISKHNKYMKRTYGSVAKAIIKRKIKTKKNKNIKNKTKDSSPLKHSSC
jgi:hypothetical protein